MADIEKIGRYRVLGLLGQGAMGVVYKAVDERIDRLVAIKTLQVNDQLDEEQQTELRKRFLQEAQFAGKVSHPNIVTIYDVAEENETPYIAMEFIDGRTLDQVVAEFDPEAPPPLEMMIDVMLQICEGLNHAHKNGIVHRDIKPSNIIVTSDGLAKIMDFGIAKFSTSTNTIVGTVLGTPAYMSPEQISGRTVDHRSDIFSLGAVFYEFLTRKKAFPGNNITEVMYHVLNENPVPISATNSSVPAVFDNIIMRALRRSPEERYRSMEYFGNDIRKLKQTLDLSRTIYVKAEDFGSAPLPDWLKFLEPLNFRKIAIGLGIYSGVLTFLFLGFLIFGGERFGYIAQSLSKQHPAALLMKLNVPDAIVSIDGTEYPTGSNMLTFDSIGVGEHKLVVKRDYYETYETALIFGAGEKKEIDVALRLLPVEIPAGVDTAFLDIRTNPPMVKVETSTGKFIGYTPIEDFAFPEGSYTLLFSKTDYVNKRRDVSFRSFRNNVMDIRLEKLRGTVSLENVIPNNATLFVSGKQLSRSLRYNRYSVEVGEQLLTIRAEGYEDIQKKVFVQVEDTVALRDTLKPVYGSLLIQSNPSGAEIFVDDATAPVGRAPVYISSLIANAHVLRGVLGNEEKKRSVKVAANDTTEVTVVFSSPNGFIELVTTPPGAEIYLNTVKRNGSKTPNKIEIKPGFHKVRLVHPSFKKFYEVNVRVRPEGTSRVSYVFE